MLVLVLVLEVWGRGLFGGMVSWVYFFSVNGLEWGGIGLVGLGDLLMRVGIVSCLFATVSKLDGECIFYIFV